MRKGRLLAVIAVLLALALLLGCAPGTITPTSVVPGGATGIPTSVTGATTTPTSGTSGGITTGTATP